MSQSCPRKRYHNYCDAKNNRFVLDRSEFLPNVDYVPDSDINTGIPEKTYYEIVEKVY